MLNAFSYGLITLIILWAGGGALPGAIASNSMTLLILMSAILFGLTKAHKNCFIKKPYKLFDSSHDQIKGVGILVITAAIVLGIKFIFPQSFASQAQSFSNSSFVLLTLVLSSLILSDFIFRQIFTPEWGPASTAFLEALAWGLSAQSFVLFVWIFVSGFLISKYTTVPGYAGSALIRFLMGALWLLII